MQLKLKKQGFKERLGFNRISKDLKYLLKSKALQIHLAMSMDREWELITHFNNKIIRSLFLNMMMKI